MSVFSKPTEAKSDIDSCFHLRISRLSSLTHGTLSPDTDRGLNGKSLPAAISTCLRG
jgi:hypothetical protein